MLRTSAQTIGGDVDLAAIVDRAGIAASLPGNRALLAFAETALDDDAKVSAEARQQVGTELGLNDQG